MRTKPRASDPIVTKNELAKLKEYMINSAKNRDLCWRNYMLVVIGVNFGLRASDLCRLKLSDLKDKTHLDIVEQKTKKRRVIFINDSVRSVIQEYLSHSIFVDENTYLFPSNKGGHITPKYIYKLIKKATVDLGWKGNYGSHTLRKTMAYHVLKASDGNPDVVFRIMQMFNHSSESVTRRYLTSSQLVDVLYSDLNL